MPEDTVRILIIDDDPDDIVILTGDLADCGYEVWTASDGEHALTQVQAQPVDIVLLDVNLPRLNGIELIPRLQTLLPEVTIILVTNYGTISQAVEALRLGAFDYLEKPADPQQLRLVITQAWQEKQTQFVGIGLAQAYVAYPEKWATNSVTYDKSALNSGWRSAVADAAAQWNNVTPSPFTFSSTTSSSNPNDVFLGNIDGQYGTYAQTLTYFPGGNITRFTLQFDSGETWTGGLGAPSSTNSI